MWAVADVVSGPIALAMGWALVHFLWQGALLTLIGAALLNAVGPDSPRARYALCFVLLVVLVTLPPVTSWVVYTPTPPETITTLGKMPSPTNEVGAGNAHTSPVVLETQRSALNPAPIPPAAGTGIPGRDYAPQAPSRHDVLASAMRWEKIRSALTPYVPVCVFLWAIGVFLMAGRNLSSWLVVRQLRNEGIGPVPDWVEALVGTLGARMGIRRAVACLESTRLTIPATVGWLKPVVLLPASTVLGLDRTQLEAVIAHELAHIRRYDYLANLFQTLAETVLFYHPAVWWLSERMRHERELCCDDLAVALCPNSTVYAAALVRVAEMRQAPAYAMAATGGSLVARIRRLAGVEDAPSSRRPSVWLSLAVIAGFCAALVVPNAPVLFAQAFEGAPGARVINFPEWSMGQLMVRPWGSELDAEWQVHQPAMGAVNVPEGMEVQLVVDNNAVTDLSPLDYLAVDDLQSINFQRTEIQDGQLIHLEGMELRDLDFELTQITNEAIQYFDDMNSLERLSVGRTNVDNAGVSQLGGLTALRYLDLNLTGVNDTGFAALENLRNLEYLDLWNAEITDESLQRIGTMAGLEVLGLEGTSITDEGIEALRQLNGLRDLNLENTPIGDEGLRHLASLTALTRLQLRNTRISDAGAAYLSGLPLLQRVSLPNQLSPEVFESLSQLSIESWHRGNAKFEIHVYDQESARPISMAHIELKARTENGMRYRPHYFWTDKEGSVSFYYRDSHTVDLTIHADGYTPTTVSWVLGQQESIDVTLSRALRIGGYVVNEQGEAVNGVSIALSLPGERDFTVDKMGQHTESSGEKGEWSCPHGTSDFTTLSVSMSHPDYIETVYTPDQLSEGRLRASNEILVIHRGLSVAGSVTDGEGTPVSGASIAVMEQRRYDLFVATDKSAWSDEAGQFTLENQRPGTAKVKVNAGGYLALVKEVEFLPDGPPLEFTLSPGYLLRGRVVDRRGQPIAGVRIETPQHTGSPGVDHLSTAWRTVTGTDGRFQWDEAPADAVFLSFSKDGYQALQKSLVASSEEIVVVIGPPLVISGTLSDQETGEPVTGPIDFSLVAHSGKRRMQFGRDKIRIEQGTYEIDVEERYWGGEAEAYQLAIHAPGYLPVESRRIAVYEGAVTEDFKLQPLTRLHGKVVGADGRPVEGAKVYAFDATQHIFLADNEPHAFGSDTPQQPVVSDGQGEFDIPAPAVVCTVFAVASSGYALLEGHPVADDLPALQLSAWAGLEVLARLGDAPDGQATVSVSCAKQAGELGRLHLTYGKRAGDDGRCGFERLVDGQYAIQKQAAATTGTTVLCMVALEPGVRESLQIGGVGKPVEGSVSVSASVDADTHWNNGMMVHLRSVPPALPYPKGHEDWTTLERGVWAGLWLQTEAGRAFTASQPPVYGFFTGLDAERRFRLEDVPEGHYQLRIEFRGEPGRANQWNPRLLGIIERGLTVESAEGNYPRQAMKLGEMRLDQSI